MTTSVTVKTHSWPVEVTTTDRYTTSQVTGGGTGDLHTLTTTVETVPPYGERQFYVTSSRTLQFAELPLPDSPPTTD